jgi:membrane-associated phospholipid phosphatase
MSRLARTLVSLLVSLLIASVLPSALAGDEPVAWYGTDTDEGLCGSCFEMEFEDAATEDPAILYPTFLFAPGTTGWNAKPYTPPNWAAGKPNTATWVTTGVIGAGWAYLWADANSTDDDETLKEVGDYTQIITPAAGLGMAIGAKDKKGLIQYGISFGVSMATVQVFKNSADRWRPDGTDQLSFPSGHTAGSFFGAGFIYQRYGPKWGVPALVMATYTGFSRVYGQKHFAGDALSGASIAMLSTLAFVKPADPERAAHYSDMERHRKWRFEFEMYQSDVTENWVQAPADTGTLLDFRFDQNSNPTINGAAALDWNVKGRHNLRFRYSPFEQRDVGSVENLTVFGDYVFPETDVFSIYFLGDIRARYAFELLPKSKFHIQLGGGVSIQEGEISLYEADLTSDVPEVDTSAGDSIHEFGVAPIVYLRLGFDFSKHFTLYAEGDGFVDSEASAYDTVLKFQYRINSMWDVAVGWRSSSFELDASELKNTFSANGWSFHAAYSF